MDGMVNEFYEPVECSSLEPGEKEQMVSRAAFEQMMWERDMAIKQLAVIGKGFGEKMDDVARLIEEERENKKMDALEFLKYAKKMCARYSDERNGAGFCQGCPALIGEDEICILNYQYKSCEPDKAVETVEKYAKEYPIETNQDRFLKIFPEARQKDGLIDICPRTVSKEHRSKSTEYGGCGLYSLKYNCEQCSKKFWLSEAK